MAASIDEMIELYHESHSEELLRDIVQSLRDICHQSNSAAGDGDILNKYGCSLLLLFNHSQEIGVLDEAIDILQQAINVAGSDNAVKAKAMNNLGDALNRKWIIGDAKEDLDASISSLQSAVQYCDSPSPSRFEYLKDLVESLNLRYEEYGSMSDLEDAIEHQRLAILCHDKPSEYDESDELDFISSLLEERFQKVHSRASLDEAIVWRSKIVSLESAKQSGDWYAYTNNLSIILLDRYQIAGELKDLQEAVEWARVSVEGISSNHDQYATLSYQLAITLQAEWDQSEKRSVLDEEIKWYEESLKGLNPGSSHISHRHNLLGVALCQRADISRVAQDIESSIENLLQAKDNSAVGSNEYVRALYNLSNAYQSAADIQCKFTSDAVRNAIETAHLAWKLKPELELSLYNLALAKKLEYDRTGSPGALEDAVQFARQSAGKTPSPRNLGLLSIVLTASFNANGSFEVLEEAVEIGRQSLRLHGEHSSDADRLVTLGNNLVLRAQWKFSNGEPRKDINDAIEYLQRAITIMDERTGRSPPGYYFNLGYALVVRWQRFGAGADQEEATKLLLKALELAKIHEPDSISSRHSNLSQVYFAKYQYVGKGEDDLNKAIEHGTLAVSYSKEKDPRLPVRRNNLGCALKSRYEDFGQQDDDIDKAIKQLKLASDSVEENSPYLPGYHHNIGMALLSKSNTQGEGIEESIEHLEKAASLSRSEQPLTGGIQASLSDALYMKYDQSMKEEDLKRAISYGERAFNIESALPAVRIRAAYRGGIWSAQSSRTVEDRQRTARLLGGAAQLLPIISPRDMARLDQQSRLSRFNAYGISADATASALDAGLPPSYALRLLETGRGVIISNLLDCRSDLSALRDVHPDLARDLEGLREEYDHYAGFASTSMNTVDTAAAGSAKAFSDKKDLYHVRISRIEEQLQKKLKEIRSQKGFENFMMLAQIEELSGLGEDGCYIVAINASQIRCDAFVIHDGQITVVPLPNLHLKELEVNEKRFREAIINCSKAATAARESLVKMLRWLWEVCGKPLVDQVFSRRAGSKVKPRVYWILGGILGRLPLHACGAYDQQSLEEEQVQAQTMFSSVISSYAPTLRALQYSREQAAQLAKNKDCLGGALIVAMPETEGAAKLRFAEEEASAIQALFGKSELLLSPSLHEVVVALLRSRIAHFACHGTSDGKDPGQSHLKLLDYRDNPLSVERLMGLKVKNCSLAYLSACDTANAEVSDLVDESLHIVSGFLLAGCPSVIGTLWKVSDDQAKHIATEFYSRLPLTEGSRDTGPSAVALHNAIKQLTFSSSEIRDPLVWTAFVHYGV